MGGARVGEITENNYPKVTSPIRLGLTELHKRFLIREGTVILTLVPGLSTYILDSKYAVSKARANSITPYLTDSKAVPFQDDVFKIERVYDASGHELPLNDREDPCSVMTPGFKTLVLPASLEGPTVKVIYRANHPALDESAWEDPEGTEIELPPAFLEALLLYVGERVTNPNGFSGGNGFHEGNNYSTKFEQACALLETKNYSIDQGTANKRLERGGWV
jgi:hypothetical protein